jgi:hypothetical protein
MKAQKQTQNCGNLFAMAQKGDMWFLYQAKITEQLEQQHPRYEQTRLQIKTYTLVTNLFSYEAT